MKRVVTGKTLLGSCAGVLAMMTMASPATGQWKSAGTPIGAWRVMSETDPMTDKKNCIAYHGSGHLIQLTETSFAVSYRGRGGLKGYTLRFDNDPPLEMELPTRMEGRIGAILIESTDARWERLKNAKRLRIEAITVLATMVNDDVDVARLSEVSARLGGPACK